ncbi:hypothetical protein FSARC_1080 [Fusarium sarcochroum]|uniref:Uncharacterized protein n=1 Tax=Fusarium sarcochroum TaxID=1208366 RepID=A0A8H4XFH7_9HYPO|nr:hypothetical protein FSARC_1080 [Fusarium sarcochroum]
MISLLSPHFQEQTVTRGDLVIASTALGFTVGFGWLTTWKAIKQTSQIYKRHGRRVFRNAYVIMIWGELLLRVLLFDPHNMGPSGTNFNRIHPREPP